jgi:DNA replication initiation complex subunit (GINS family)
MYQELRDSWRLERSSFKLQRLDPALYERLRAHVAKLASILEEGPSLAKRVASLELEVLKALAQDLFSLRVRKALTQALEGQDPTPLLTREEAEAVSAALKALSEAEELLSSELSARYERPKMKLVRMLKEAPIEVASDYAPLKAESLALLPANVAEKLVSEGYAMMID